MIFKKIKINTQKGFVILFAVTISSIILAIALGVANISFREMKFSTNVKDSNNAFFAADTGLEYVLMNDKYPSTLYPVGATTNIDIFGLDSGGKSCAHVAITKTSATTTIVSKGLSAGVNNSGTCTASGVSVERELKATYGGVGSSNSASFVTLDTVTKGSWHGVYGADGYNIFGATQSYPSYATVTPVGNSTYTWADPTGDVRGLYKDSVTTSRIASTWYSDTNFTLDVNITDGASHQVAIYMVDWDTYGPRQARVEVLDGVTSNVLDTQNLTGYVGGDYLVWNVSGHVIFKFTDIASGTSNVVTSGIFFGGGSVNTTNYAASANGGVATASSTFSSPSNFPIAAINEGDRLGNSWSNGSCSSSPSGCGWNDNTANTYTDWAQVTFSGPKTINKIDVYTLANCFGGCAVIDSSTPANTYGIKDFRVQYDNGSGWIDVSGGNVTNNTLAWRTFSFGAISNVTSVRVLISASNSGDYSRLVEIEAY